MIIDWNDPEFKEAMMQAATDPTYHWRQEGEAKDKEIERLRAALRDMIEISKRNSEPTLMLLAIRMCAIDALGGKNAAPPP